MPCYSPLEGYVSKDRNASGKRSLVFDSKAGFIDRPMVVPCGRCIGCRLEYSRQWAMRCLHEASLYDDNCFVTLTYSEDFLPEFGSLRKRDFQKFMKRLRKKFSDEKIRFYHCGEYGSISGRPHYHSLLFGFDFTDKYPWTVRGNNQVWRSDSLEKLWPYGQSEIGSVSFESAAYCARYMTKKFKGSSEDVEAFYSVYSEDSSEVLGRREQEYATMSRRPGIGKAWFDKFKCEVYPADSVIVRGREVKPPKFYDGLYELANPSDMDSVRLCRRRSRSKVDETPERLEDRRRVTQARVNVFERRVI